MEEPDGRVTVVPDGVDDWSTVDSVEAPGATVVGPELILVPIVGLVDCCVAGDVAPAVLEDGVYVESELIDRDVL